MGGTASASEGFRADIEGLRALAILPILIFHLDPAAMPGGFIGVDIFFVISGFLISGQILRSRPDEFRFVQFYIRRIRRLFPALAVTVTVSLAFAWKLFTPSDLVGVAKSALASLAGVANIYFYASVDYFNENALLHPLLHVWSLSLEEQFYLIWPAFLILAARLGRHALLGAVVTAGLLSLAGSMVFLRQDPYLAFYMMPLRIFEFAIGCIALLLNARPRPLISMLCGALGTAILIASCFIFDGNSPWPGARALLPSVGTALLLVAGREGPWHAVLSFAPLRWIGRISYSVYLVHWPLIVFYRYWLLVPPTAMELSGLLAASLIFGALLYLTVERFYRISAEPKMAWTFGWTKRMSLGATLLGRMAAQHPGRIFAIFLLVPAGAIGFSSAIIAKAGFPDRMKIDRVQQHGGELSFAGDLCRASGSRCGFGATTSPRIVYLLGDSHALNLVYGLDVFFKEHDIRGITFYDHGCLFLYGTTRFLRGVPDEGCAKNVARAFETIARDRHPVILAGSYAGYVHQIGDVGARSPFDGVGQTYIDWIGMRLERSLQFIGARERRVAVIAASYDAGIDIGKCVLAPSQRLPGSSCAPTSPTAIKRSTKLVDDMIERLPDRFPGLTVLDPKAAFCTLESCTVVENGVAYFRDQTHLTNEGSAFLISRMSPQLLEALKP
jgi:peptidoglycan/LPS O-acetylase OafA/YrhL